MTASNSLGALRNDKQNDHLTRKYVPTAPATVVVEVAPARSFFPACSVGTIKGFLPTFAYAALALLVPLVLDFVTIDAHDNVTRGVTIGLSAVAAGLVVYADDCVTWYNIVLFFHTGVEVMLVYIGFDYAYADDRKDVEMALSLAGTITIIVHLIPFFLLDTKWLLTLLAAAGVVVNTAMVVFLVPQKAYDELLLLLYGGSSLALLAVTLIVVGVNCMKPSMLTLLRGSLMEGSCLKCVPYEM